MALLPGTHLHPAEAFIRTIMLAFRWFGIPFWLIFYGCPSGSPLASLGLWSSGLAANRRRNSVFPAVDRLPPILHPSIFKSCPIGRSVPNEKRLINAREGAVRVVVPQEPVLANRRRGAARPAGNQLRPPKPISSRGESSSRHFPLESRPPCSGWDVSGGPSANSGSSARASM